MGSYSKHTVEVETLFKEKGNTKRTVKSLDDIGKALNKSEKESQKRGLMMEKASAKGEKLIHKNILSKEKDGKKRREQLSSVEARTKTYDKIQKSHNLTQAETDRVFSQAGLRINKNGGIVDRAGKLQKSYGKSIRNNVGALGRFNMEQLGVMFGGMALNRAMSQLNATSREWLGIGELTSTMMGITLLDANIDLLEYGVLPLFDALTNLPPAAQKALGYLVMGLEGLGGMMMVGGQLMLGLDSTATLLSKIAGVKPHMIFTSKGLGAIKTKLGPVVSRLKTIGKYAVTAIAISWAIEDLKEGELTAAAGDIAMGVGFMTGTPWAIGVGVFLKILGDEEWRAGFAKFAVVMYDNVAALAEWINDTLNKSLSLRWDEIDWGGPMVLFDEMDKVGAQMVLSGEAKSAALLNRIGGVEGAYSAMTDSLNRDLDEANEKFEKGLTTSEEHGNKIGEIHQKYEDLLPELDTMVTYYEDLNLGADSLLETMGKIYLKISPISRFTDLFKEDKPLWQKAIDYVLPGTPAEWLTPKAIGGPIRNTGRYYLHEGEEVISKTDVNSGKIVDNTTYHVTVSDKKEFESLLRKNNQQLTSEVRKIVRV